MACEERGRGLAYCKISAGLNNCNSQYLFDFSTILIQIDQMEDGLDIHIKVTL